MPLRYQASLLDKLGEVMKVFKRILKWIGAILGIVVLLGIAQAGWGMHREPIAKKQAEDFCGTISIGQSIDGIAERAIASDAEARFAKWTTGSDGIRMMHVMYIGMPPFSRHTCSIKANTAVTSAEYVHMD
jgi:hypothetical protein